MTRRTLAVAVAGVFALASMMLLPGTASSQTADQITLTIVQVATGARDVETAPGGAVRMTIGASGAEAMQGLQFTLGYNPAVVEVVDVALAESRPGALFAANTATLSKIVVIFVEQAPVGVDKLDIASVAFRVVGEPGASTSRGFTAIAAADSSDPSQAISATAVSGSITVKSRAPLAEATPTAIPAATPVPAATTAAGAPTPAPSPSSPAVTPAAEQTPVATPESAPPSSPEPTSTATAVPVAMAPTAEPTTQAPAVSPTQARPEPSPTAATGAEAQKPQEVASSAPLAAQVAGVQQRPEAASTPELGAAAPTPSAAQVQVQAPQTGSEPSSVPPPEEPQGGMGCSAPLRGSSTSASGLGDLMLLGMVVGSLLISSRLRRQR